jgi:hypothetical protein
MRHGYKTHRKLLLHQTDKQDCSTAQSRANANVCMLLQYPDPLHPSEKLISCLYNARSMLVLKLWLTHPQQKLLQNSECIHQRVAQVMSPFNCLILWHLRPLLRLHDVKCVMSNTVSLLAWCHPATSRYSKPWQTQQVLQVSCCP